MQERASERERDRERVCVGVWVCVREKKKTHLANNNEGLGCYFTFVYNEQDLSAEESKTAGIQWNNFAPDKQPVEKLNRAVVAKWVNASINP